MQIDKDVIYLKQRVLRVLLITFVVIFAVSGYFLLNYWINSKEQQAQFEELVDVVQQAKQEMQAATNPESQEPDTNTEETAQASSSPQVVEVKDPKTGAKRSVLGEYVTIYLMNQDTVGWMQIEGTEINYPVMQTPESPDYYLYRNFRKEGSSHGCLYVREACNVEKPSDNLTIYGHKIKDGSMFAGLHEYENKAFWEQHRFIQFDTLTQHNTYEILSVFLTTASEEGFAYHEFVDAADEAEFDDFVATCKQLALYDTGVTAEYGDKLITLSTCEYSQTNGRLVVVAKRISE